MPFSQLFLPTAFLCCCIACAQSSVPEGEPPSGTEPVDSDAGVRSDAEVAPDAGHPRDGGTAGHDDAGGGETDSGTATPERSEPPPFPTYSGGACPALVSGTARDDSLNVGFDSGGDARSFRLLVPDTYDPDGTDEWPLLFAWHWLNSSSGSFVEDGELDTAAREMGFIAVLPDSPRDASGNHRYQFDWPFAESWGAEQELTFFDDLLACVSEQFRVDRRRVHGVGVSAGALWITYLSTTSRVNHIASLISLSGGLGDEFGVWRMEYEAQPNKFPAIVLWGGTSDWLGLSFDQASRRYRDALLDDGHFVIQCVHDSGHAMPPIDPPADGGTRFRGLWRFLLDHPYGLPPGESPWQESGIPGDVPSWCSIAG